MSAEIPAAEYTPLDLYTIKNMCNFLYTFSVGLSRGKRTEETRLLHGLGVGISERKKNAKRFLDQSLNHFIH
jgi:hypothetical protein